MLSTAHRVAVVALASTLALVALSADAAAKSSRSKSRATAASVAPQSAPSGSYYYQPGRAIPPFPTGITGRGNVLDNTAGWGDVGAR